MAPRLLQKYILYEMELDGNNHVTSVEEEAAGTRLVFLLMEGLVCVRCVIQPLVIDSSIQNDHDPSKLIAETPCKILRYLVTDGSQFDADTPNAEVEVMKMCVPLLSPTSGKIHLKISEGQAMQAGEHIARLDLDDPSAVRKAEPFCGSSKLAQLLGIIPSSLSCSGKNALLFWQIDYLRSLDMSWKKI